METTEVGDKLMHNRIVLMAKSAFVRCSTRLSKRIENKCLIFEVFVRIFSPEENLCLNESDNDCRA